MNFLRLLTLTLLACFLAFATAAHAASPAEQRLVGIWQDDGDPDNIIQFFPDHRVRIFVPKSAGQGPKVHWINGRWRLSHGRHLTLKLNTPAGLGKPGIRKFTVHFTGRGMEVKSGRTVLGTQHRISQETLKKHLW